MDMRDYEMVLLIDSDLELDLDKPIKKVEKIIQDNGGTVTSTDTWGKRRLAYQINKKDFAVYVFMQLQVPPANLSGIENTMNITKEVVRYIITNPVPAVVFPGKDPNENKDSREARDKASDK